MVDKVRLGLIGASVQGTWSSRSHLPALKRHPDFELTAVCTTKQESAEATRKAYGARFAFDDYRKMVTSSEIDAVAVVVRVPSHYEPTKAALQAGKHVYCEWPLGRTTKEAEELASMALAKGVITAIGLQARAHPLLLHARELIESGFVGEVLAIRVGFLMEGVLARPSHRTWQRDVSLGANTLTISNGHVLDAMRFVVGDFQHLSALITTQVDQWIDTGTNTPLDVTSPDNILIQGRLNSGAVASVQTGSIPFAGSGYRMEIYGREGTLVFEGEDSPQLGKIALYGARGGDKPAPILAPKKFAEPADRLEPTEAVNVGRLYTSFAQAIRGEHSAHPTFETALDLHHIIDGIRHSSDQGAKVDLI